MTLMSSRVVMTVPRVHQAADADPSQPDATCENGARMIVSSTRARADGDPGVVGFHRGFERARTAASLITRRLDELRDCASPDWRSRRWRLRRRPESARACAESSSTSTWPSLHTLTVIEAHGRDGVRCLGRHLDRLIRAGRAEAR